MEYVPVMFENFAIPDPPSRELAPRELAPRELAPRETVPRETVPAEMTPGKSKTRRDSGPPLVPAAHATLLRDLRDKIARIEHRHLLSPAAVPGAPVDHLPLHIPAIDNALPGGGIALHALHEAMSGGPDTEHAAAATLFVAGLLARMSGPVLWVLRQADLFAPALAAVGLPPQRLIFAEAGRDVLTIMEEGLRHPGLAAVVGEPAGRISLVASRRLQLAAEQAGVMAVLLRRSQTFDDPAHQEPSAAFTRWRVTSLPSTELPTELPARWQLDLLRCRGGEKGSWIVGACDATGHLGLAADTPDRSDQAA
jgi:protein ImuA